MGFHTRKLHRDLEAAQQLQKAGFEQLAAANRMAAAMCFLNPSLARVFEATADCAEISAHTPEPARFDITSTEIDGVTYDVEEENVLVFPHATLKRFHVHGLERECASALEIAPMSGHPAANLLRDAAKEMIQHHDYYVIDWHDPRTVPHELGEFDLNNYMHYIIKALEHIGPNAHVIADCQPGFPLVGALSVMETTDHPCLPLTATFKGSPLNTAISPTKVNTNSKPLVQLAGGKDGAVKFFQENYIGPVSSPHAGEGQPVMHNLFQLANFYGIAPTDHAYSRMKHWRNIALGANPEEVIRHRNFYKEFDQGHDLAGPYLWQTFERAFLNQGIADGTFFYKDPETGDVHHVNPANITRVAVLAVEGQKDTITGLGQTADILNMMTSLDPRMKQYLRVSGGHYSLFSGSKYRDVIRPLTSAHIHDAELRANNAKYESSDPPFDMRAFLYSIKEHPELLEQRPEFA